MDAPARRCTATSKQSGERCKRRAAVGRTVCIIHGGRTLSGIAHPNWTHGGYSAAVPPALRDAYDRAMADADLLDLTRDLALIDAEIRELLPQTETGDHEAAWLRSRDLWSAFAAAERRGDLPGLQAAINELQALYADGPRPSDARTRIDDLIERRARLVAVEQRRRVAGQTLVTIEQAMTAMGALMAAVRAHVADRPTLAAIQAEYARLVGRPPVTS
jgi:hypothetical protein